MKTPIIIASIIYTLTFIVCLILENYMAASGYFCCILLVLSKLEQIREDKIKQTRQWIE